MMATQALDDGFAGDLVDRQPTPPSTRTTSRSCRKPRWPLVAGLYVRKGKAGAGRQVRSSPGTIPFGVGGKPMPMQYVGMGFTLVRARIALPPHRGGPGPGADRRGLRGAG
jgi:hypothetical protein